MTLYVKQGNTFRPTANANLDIHETLAPRNYVLKQDQQGFYFEEVDAFELPKKLYGETLKHTDRILSTFEKRTVSTGILLAGEKGSGKTLLARNLGIHAATKGMPTIIINTPFHGDEFNTVMQSVEQPCVVLFDEFEKVYEDRQQERMLTLLDGVFPTKKLFILTCNNRWKVNEHMINRPGRIFYKLTYAGISAEFVRDYCEDVLINKAYIGHLVKMRAIFHKFNFDMLKAIVEEMNRYDETPQQALEMLNIEIDYNRHQRYGIEMEIDGKKIDQTCYHPIDTNIQPVAQALDLRINLTKAEVRLGEGAKQKGPLIVSEGDEDREDVFFPSILTLGNSVGTRGKAASKLKVEEDDWQDIALTPDHITTIGEDGSYTYVLDNVRLVLKKPVEKSYSYLDRSYD